MFYITISRKEVTFIYSFAHCDRIKNQRADCAGVEEMFPQQKKMYNYSEKYMCIELSQFGEQSVLFHKNFDSSKRKNFSTFRFTLHNDAN